MSTSPRDILDLAEIIVSASAHSECGCRSGISRAYYACLLRAEELFEGDGSEDAPSHERIIRATANYGVGANPGRRSASELATLLKKLKRARVKSDYHIEQDVTRREFDDVKALAMRAFELCDLVIAARARVEAQNATAGAPPPSAPGHDDDPPPTGPRPTLKRIK